MVTKIVMPRLSLTMKEGTVVQWFKKEGENVQKGEPLVEVLSEKVTYDVEAPESGILRKVLANEGSSVPVDYAIGIITGQDEPMPTELSAVGSLSIVGQAEPIAPKSEIETVDRVPASPAAKKLARELNVDLTLVSGTGPEGRIVEDDVKRFSEQVAGKPKVREINPLVGIRKTTADRLSFSARTAPHTSITMEVDVSKAARLHETMAFSYTAMIVKASAIALRDHLYMNSALNDDQITVFEDINVGVAVATGKGLLVPVVHNADKKTLRELSEILEELAGKAAQGKLTKDELTGGTFTVTNLGMYGVDVFIPIINPPEAAILGVGRTSERPFLTDNEVKMKPVLHLSLSFDHRIVDGAPAAQFLQRVKQVLEDELDSML